MTPLLARVTSADRQFERIYQRHAAEVYRYVLVVLRNPHDAEDVTQTTFMNAYRAMQGGERPESPKNWLIAIAHNVCRQRFRQAQRRPQESTLYEESIVEEPADPKHSAEDLQRALGQLAFNQRAALMMRELEGRSYAEIAEVMGLSVGAVETVIFRARRALREQLETSLTCDEAERSLSRQLDGELPRADRGPLRAHLRECKECAQLARSQRASRGAVKALLGGIPVPASFLGGGSGATLGLAAKAAVVVCAGAVVGTGGYEAQQAISAKPTARASKANVTHSAGAPPVVTAGAAHPAARAPVARALHGTAQKRAAIKSHVQTVAGRSHQARTNHGQAVAAAIAVTHAHGPSAAPTVKHATKLSVFKATPHKAALHKAALHKAAVQTARAAATRKRVARLRKGVRGTSAARPLTTAPVTTTPASHGTAHSSSGSLKHADGSLVVDKTTDQLAAAGHQ